VFFFFFLIQMVKIDLKYASAKQRLFNEKRAHIPEF